MRRFLASPQAVPGAMQRLRASVEGVIGHRGSDQRSELRQLPKPPGILRRFWLRHAVLADALIATVGFVGGYLTNIDTGRGLDHLDWLVGGWFGLPILAGIALLIRRSRPILSLSTIFICSAVLELTGHTILLVPLLLAIYALAVYGSAPRAWIAAGLCVGLDWIMTTVARVSDPGVKTLIALFAIVLLLGTSIGNRRRYLEALIAHAAQLARERDQQAQLATAAERARIARELHDVIAHSLSVMVRLADGADAIADSDPEKSRAAVQQIASTGRESLRDMRRLLGVLRDGESPALGPVPGLGDLSRLVESYRSAGLPVTLTEQGTPPASEALQLAIYRATQEALTNALRYAQQPSRVLVRLDYGPSGVVLEVTDDGAPPTTAPSSSTAIGSGRGLVGLRERAALYGGTIEAGPITSGPTTDPLADPQSRQTSGWRVRMTLPQNREDDR